MINIKYLHCLLLSIGAIIFWWPMGRINVLSFPFFSCSTSWYYLHLWCLLLFVLFCIIWSLSLYNIVVVFTIHWHESAMGVHESPILNLPLHLTPLGCPSALALSALFQASNLDWSSISHMIIYVFQYYSSKSSHPHLLLQSPKVCSLHLYLLLSCIYSCHYHLSKFRIYALIYCIGVFLSDLLHAV